jgi:hypothetical protein
MQEQREDVAQYCKVKNDEGLGRERESIAKDIIGLGKDSEKGIS